MKYNVSEIFYSVAGEGPDAGRPAIFVRFSGCNLRCKFGDSICDTPYTSYQPEVNMMKAKKILEKIKEYDCKYVILTGGEPTIQNIRPLVLALKKQDYEVAIETNGSHPTHKACRNVISPKVKENPDWPGFQKYYDDVCVNVMRADKNGHDVFLKFVVEGEDISEILSFLAKTMFLDKRANRSRVYLMPEGITPEQVAKNGIWAWKKALEHGFRYCNRYHVQLFGNQRGK
jgi:7-carboxy-7-deazaguanine synthase